MVRNQNPQWIPICTDHPQYFAYNPVITPKLIINQQWLSRSHLYSAPELRKQANEKEGRRKDAHLHGDISMGQNEVLDFSTWDVWKSINSDEHKYTYTYYTDILCTHVQILHN